MHNMFVLCVVHHHFYVLCVGRGVWSGDDVGRWKRRRQQILPSPPFPPCFSEREKDWKIAAATSLAKRRGFWGCLASTSSSSQWLAFLHKTRERRRRMDADISLSAEMLSFPLPPPLSLSDRAFCCCWELAKIPGCCQGRSVPFLLPPPLIQPRLCIWESEACQRDVWGGREGEDIRLPSLRPHPFKRGSFFCPLNHQQGSLPLSWKLLFMLGREGRKKNGGGGR